MAADLTVEILREIRDGIRTMNLDMNARFERMDERFERMDERSERMDERSERMDQRLGRVEQGLSDLGKFMRQIALDQARHERFHANHVDLLEQDMADLKGRVRRLEERG